MSNFWLIFGLWYACGFVILLNEIRHGVDVTVAWILYAICFAPLGLLWLFSTADRLGWFSWVKSTCLDKIVIKRVNKQGN